MHVVLDLYGRYALSYNISETETSSAVIDTFMRAFEDEQDVHPMVHTDRGAAYCSMDFNNYLTENKCVHSMSHPRASMGEFTYGTLVERLQAHLDGSSSTACQP